MPNRLLCLALLAVVSFGAQAQNKTLTFTNANPQKTIHLVDGSTVSIATSGNLTAQCVLSGSGCADVGSGSNPNAPTVALGLSGFSTGPDGNGAYAPGTSFTITPTVSNADVCIRTVTAGSPSDTGWTGTTTAPGAQTLQVNTGSSTYGFVLTCYNAAGSASATSSNVTTSAGTGGGGVGEADCSGFTSTPPGFTRDNTTTWMQLFGAASFPDQNIAAAQVPHRTDAGLVWLGAPKNQYTSVKFTTPATTWTGSQFNWTESQIAGGPTAALASGVYITISRCPGDFRLANDNSAEPTDHSACKSFRYSTYALSIEYNQSGASTPGTCGLAPSTTYYLNYVTADAAGGITAGEHSTASCTSCGVALKEQ